MGDAKQNMTPTKKSDTLKDKAMGFFKAKKPKLDAADKGTNFADLITLADTVLNDLVIAKEKDFEHESGKEVENRKKLALLQTMQFHLDCIIEAGHDYTES